MRRVLDVARIQTVNWQFVLTLPLGVLAGTFVINLVVFGTVLATVGGPANAAGFNTGALSSLYIVAGISHLQTMTQVFPFAVGLSVTRRTFYAATALVVLAQSAAFGLLVTILQVIERATGGFGVRMTFFDFGFLAQDNVILQWLVYTVPLLAVSALGVSTGVVFARWGQWGIWAVVLGASVLGAGLTMLITWQRWWEAVGTFFAGQSSFALVAGYPSVIVLVLGVAGWLAIRRATP